MSEMHPAMNEGTPVDTYSNIPTEEEAAVKASQLPDEEMESHHEDFILDQAINIEDQDYLLDALEGDPRLSTIFDKVMDVATEFSGAGEVDGLGDGTSDSIPARLSDGEFVFTKKAVDYIGPQKLQTMMDEAERAYDEENGKVAMNTGGYVENGERVRSDLKEDMVNSDQMPSRIR